MSYLAELRGEWRALAAASLGMAVGYTFTNYVTNIVSPALIGAFGWSKAEFALLGLTVALAIVCQPLGGRLADAFGVRRVALIGVIAAPLLFLLLSRMTGAFGTFYAINVAQVVLVGGTTSAVVYTRLIADRFGRARGTALGIAACAPAAAGATLAPVLSMLVDGSGWRSTYVAVAGFVAVGGIVALLLAPPERARPARTGGARAPVPYGAILRSRAFRLVVAGIILCNVTLTLQMTQIKIVLLDGGIGSTAGSLMLSLYAIGNVAGRLLCGIALDRWSPPRVAALTMAAPAIGLFILAGGTGSVALAAAGVAVLGLATGAEGDVGAYLVMRYFPRSVYGSVFGLVMGALALSGVIGALLLSYTLGVTGSFRTFLVIGGVAALLGGTMFLRLASEPAIDDDARTA